ncbi:MAG: hypothetical protein OCD01_06210 [Fibrobacterales bacterium]
MHFISILSLFYLLLYVLIFSQGCGGSSVGSEELSSSSAVEVKTVTTEELDHVEKLLHNIELQLQDTFVDTTTRPQTYYQLTQAVGGLEDIKERLIFELDTAQDALYKDTIQLRVFKVDFLYNYYLPMLP